MKNLKPSLFLVTVLIMAMSFAVSTSMQAQACIPTLIGVPDDVFIACGADLPAWPTVTASTNCGPVTITTEQHVTGSRCGTYVYERRWTATSGTGSITEVQHIRFLDEKPPVLEVPEDTVVQCGQVIPDGEVLCDDACSWNEVVLEESITKHNDCEYTLVRTWTATDGCGNATQKKQTIEVVDTVAPEIKVVSPKLKGIELGEEVPSYDCKSPQVYLSDIVATDCCKDLTVEAYDQLLVNGKCDKYGYFRKWRCGYIATDGAGNTTDFYFFMVLYDDEAPILHNVPADDTLACDEEVPGLGEAMVEAEDNCTRRTNPEVTEEYTYDPADSSNFAVKRTWYFEDDCGNAVEDSQWIFSCDFDQSLIGGDSTEQDTTIGGVAPTVISTSGNPIINSATAGQQVFEVFPNPTNGYTSLKFSVSQSEKLQIKLIDKLGRVILSKNTSYDRGNYVEALDLTPYPSGFYTVVLTGKSGSTYGNLIKTD